MSQATSSDCRTEKGVSIGLVDAIIAILRVLKDRDLSDADIQEALKDFVGDEDLKTVLLAIGYKVVPHEID